MDRSTLSLSLLLCCAAAACGDPLIVIGDAPGRMRIVAGVGDSIGTHVDTLATRTRLTEPAAVAFDDATGTLYVADRGASVTANGVTRRVARIFAVQSTGRSALILDSSTCPSSCPEAIHSMVVDPGGSLLLTDIVGHRIFRLSPVASQPDIIAGTGSAGDSPDGVVAQGAAIRAPAGIAIGPDGRIHFAEQLGHRVRVIRADGRLATIAGIGTAGFSGDDGPAVDARLNSPTGLVFGAGRLFVADRVNNRVRVIDTATGVISTIAGTGAAAFGGDGGPARGASIDRPESLALSSDGLTLLIADWANNRVRGVNLATGIIRTFAGDGGSAYNGADRPAGATTLLRPSGLGTSARGFLFIADTGHSIVWRTLFAL